MTLIYPHHHAQAIALLAVPAPTPLRTFAAAPLTPEALSVAALVHRQRAMAAPAAMLDPMVLHHHITPMCTRLLQRHAYRCAA